MTEHSPEELLALFADVAAAITEALGRLDDWGPAGTRPGQYRCDLAADEAAIGILLEGGVGVCSEESGLHAADRPIMVVLDPVDGSTNAAMGFPWYATSLCALDSGGALAAHVQNLASGELYTASREGGAFRDGQPIKASSKTHLSESVIGVSGYPARHFGWWQMRSRGASALDLCAVADGRLDGFLDCGAHKPWDYLGAMLLCEEAGAMMRDAAGRDLTVADPEEVRTLLAAGTSNLMESLIRCSVEQS